MTPPAISLFTNLSPEDISFVHESVWPEYERASFLFQLKPFDLEQNQGEGVVKNDDKGQAKFCLEVSAGDRVIIVKINDCPPGKWICKMTENGRGT